MCVCVYTCIVSRAVILNRGPHGPPGGNLQVLGGGGNTEHLGNWGGMVPFGGNQQIAINRPGCSSGITGLNKLQLYVLALKMALDADRA